MKFQNPSDDKDKKEKAPSPSPLKDLEGSANGGPGATHSMMLVPNGLSEDDKAFKYVPFSVLLANVHPVSEC